MNDKISLDEIEHHIQHDHYSHRMGWLRAAVLGANDGIISVVSILMGVIASGMPKEQILLVSIAALIAGALSMAAGEYVSVSSQADTEAADIAKEKTYLEQHWDREKAELAKLYEQRGVSPETAEKVATELMEHDALDAHLRDELGLSEVHSARPIQAALASAASFTAGSLLPVILVYFVNSAHLGWILASFSLTLLGILGALAAHVGGANKIRGALRVIFWGAVAMAITSLIGYYFDVNV